MSNTPPLRASGASSVQGPALDVIVLVRSDERISQLDGEPAARQASASALVWGSAGKSRP
ncbi:hypothetical protein [Nonomuraea sp. NPDC049607]|uniref:hypothetical protein n=1 Tax=Nonomuraea sp. NPDC049607 TaxID=3154732 RepID=UPI00342398E8